MKELGANIHVRSITFNDGTKLEFGKSDIVVLTGTNNAGKSSLLREINNAYISDKTPRVIIQTIDFEYTGRPSEDFLKERLSGYPGKYRLGKNYIGTLENFYSYWNNHDIYYAGRLCKTYLPTETRLKLANPCESINFAKEKASEPLQIVYKDDGIEKKLDEMFYKAFQSHIILNRGAGSTIPLHVGSKISLENNEDRVSTTYLEKLDKLPQLQDQGDGMRSLIGILLHVITNKRSAILVDEPEAFLHPPQARMLGNLLVNNVTADTQLFLATHSEDMLKGILESGNNNVKVIRISREGNINQISQLNNLEIETLWKDPLLRYSNTFSGLFHSKVIICEADTDCRFYQAVLNENINAKGQYSPDFLFTYCGGKQRMKTIISALRAINVKTAAIADIDVLNDKKTISELIDSSGGNFADIEQRWKVLDGYVKSQRAQLNTEEVRKSIKQLLDSEEEEHLSKDITDKIKKELKASSAWAKVKETGKSFFAGDAYNAFNDISTFCKRYGIFFVPVGELECFYKPDSNHGTRWVNNVLDNVDLRTDPELASARDFMTEIEQY